MVRRRHRGGSSEMVGALVGEQLDLLHANRVAG
jgi:hypothetical protein